MPMNPDQADDRFRGEDSDNRPSAGQSTVGFDRPGDPTSHYHGLSAGKKEDNAFTPAQLLKQEQHASKTFTLAFEDFLSEPTDYNERRLHDTARLYRTAWMKGRKRVVVSG